MSALPDPGLIARFRGDVEAALGRGIDQRDVIALAVSGGPDSMAMLALATAAFPGQVTAATVDHGLRQASVGEAAMVADYCAQIGVAHATLSIAEPRDPRDNLHDWARGQRYALLKRWAVDQGARVLATAHHADDQAETFLMRAARGSGVAGLAGIRQWQQLDTTPPLDLLRPLLQWRATELRGIAAAGGIPFVDDPSNIDDRFDRTGFRALLRETSLLDAAQLARAAAHVAEVDGALRAIELWLGKSRQVVPTGVDDPDDQLWIDMADLPRELRRRLVRSAIHSVRTIHDITRPDFSDATNIESLLDALQAGKSATQAGVLVSPKRTIWRFSLAPPRRSL